MTGRTWLGLGVIAVLGAVLACVQFVLVLQTWSDPIANDSYRRLAALFQGLAGIIYTTLGVVVCPASTTAGHRLARGDDWNRHSPVPVHLRVRPSRALWPSRSLGSVQARPAVLSQTTWSLAFGPIPILLLVYPTGRLLSKRWIWAALAPPCWPCS